MKAKHNSQTAPDLSLTNWLSAVESGMTDKFTITYMFPTDAMLQEYLGGIAKRSERELKDLVRRFLISSGSLGADDHMYADARHAMEFDRPRFDRLMQS